MTSGGSDVLQEMTPEGRASDPSNGDDDPVTMIYVDGDKLTLIMYCDTGKNRPRMLGTRSADGKRLEFVMVDFGGDRTHGIMDRATFSIGDASHHTESWHHLAPGGLRSMRSWISLACRSTSRMRAWIRSLVARPLLATWRHASMRALTSKVAVLVLPTALFACSRTAAAPALGYWVASDSSQYSPTVRLRVVTAWGGSNLTVVLDSGVIAVPGALSAESPPMMRDLYMVAYVAIPNTTPMGFVRDSRAQFADRRGWKVAAASDSIRVAGQLRFGEQRVIGSVQLRVNGAPRGEGSAWLVLGITGESLDLRIPFDESSGLRAGSPGKRRVQVYACSDRDLGGQLDTTRSNAMRRAYGAVC